MNAGTTSATSRSQRLPSGHISHCLLLPLLLGLVSRLVRFADDEVVFPSLSPESPPPQPSRAHSSLSDTDRQPVFLVAYCYCCWPPNTATRKTELLNVLFVKNLDRLSSSVRRIGLEIKAVTLPSGVCADARVP